MVIGICTADEHCKEVLKGFFDSVQPECEVKIFSTVFALVTYLYDEVRGRADAVYMDEWIAGENGVEVARDLQNCFPVLQMVFLIGETSRAEEVFLAKPAYLLRKPLDSKYVQASYERIQEETVRESEKSLTVISKGLLQKIRTDKIHYIESQGRKLLIYSTDYLRETNMTLEEVSEQLPKQFFRCHRSYIVNLQSVVSVLPGEVVLCNHRTIPVSRSRYEELKSILMRN